MADTAIDTDSDAEVKKPVKEIPVIQDQGFFQHDTGDVYNGYFEAKKKDRSVKMHGTGMYTTAEGEVYTGAWDADRLGANEVATITFIDTSRYEGYIKDWCFAGRGKYFYPDGSVLHCDFVDNCPMGRLMLTDPNGHTWLGKADPGYGWFEPVNHFYDMLEKTREPLKAKRRHKSKELQEATPTVSKMKAKSVVKRA
ncbi:hypothetical protein K1T71_009693 [Dendrolimus kikuchii]|uniref:Uncharacterized protein n=1 Tax=Dendrolimus kikuchii TaxID=765133 RepID=A0ACC1CSK4_9NEOP|nr:hypothetical protein K1T71_009693 [Dendrolimus kikuchii]